MIFFLFSCFAFIILTIKSPPSWWNSRPMSGNMLISPIKMLGRKKSIPEEEKVEELSETSVLDLPELTLELILGKLEPTELCNMVGVCASLRERCRSDHLWERHMEEKWGRLIGPAARKEWERFLASGEDSPCGIAGKGKSKLAIGTFSLVSPLSWLKGKLHSSCDKHGCYVPDDSIMSWFLALHSGRFWFPAQIYNREHGHVGFMLSCYDAVVSYDSQTDTFQARYPPHGSRTIVVEEAVQWDRLRAPPVVTSAHELHASDCLNDLRPGDHIEIQWRRNKEFPYGWWYGVVGHLLSCDGNEYHCRCHKNDTVALEFNQYTPGSRWRRTEIDRKNHREEGNETDGFYGGIRKLHNHEEISMWKGLWPGNTLE